MILIVAAKISFLAGQICHVGKIMVKSYFSQVKSSTFAGKKSVFGAPDLKLLGPEPFNLQLHGVPGCFRE
jgi:hypothetical protein